MEANRARPKWTYEEFARLPASRSTRYEIIDDELVVTPSPGMRHQRIVTELLGILREFIRAHDLGEIFVGPFDVLFAPGDYLEPDLLFVRRERSYVLSERGVVGPPDLVIEVVSPSSESRDRGVKLERYRLYGVPEYWVVDPVARSVEYWRLDEEALTPAMLGPDDVLRWAPAGDSGPVLEVKVGELVPA